MCESATVRCETENERDVANRSDAVTGAESGDVERERERKRERERRRERRYSGGTATVHVRFHVARGI